MKTLRETLSDLKTKQKIKIGAADGSSWFVISTVETVQNNIDEIDKALTSYLENRHKKAEDALASALRNPMDMKAYMNKQLIRHKDSMIPDFSWEGYMVEFKKYCDGLESKRKTCIDTEDAMKTAKPLLYREVIDVSKSIKGDGVRILVEGNEEGLWWDASEKKGDKDYGFRANSVSDAE